MREYGMLTIKGVTRPVVMTNVDKRLGENPILTVELLPRHDTESTIEIIRRRNVTRRVFDCYKQGIKKVIFNNPATIVIWGDDSKTVVKCQPGDEYSRETGLAMCIAKRYLGDKGNFNEVFKKYIEDYDPRKK